MRSRLPYSGRTLAELADKAGIDADKLAVSVARNNRFRGRRHR